MAKTRTFIAVEAIDGVHAQAQSLTAINSPYPAARRAIAPPLAVTTVAILHSYCGDLRFAVRVVAEQLGTCEERCGEGGT